MLLENIAAKFLITVVIALCCSDGVLARCRDGFSMSMELLRVMHAQSRFSLAFRRFIGSASPRPHRSTGIPSARVTARSCNSKVGNGGTSFDEVLERRRHARLTQQNRPKAELQALGSERRETSDPPKKRGDGGNVLGGRNGKWKQHCEILFSLLPLQGTCGLRLALCDKVVFHTAL